MDINKLIVPVTEAKFDFPGMDGFVVTLAYLSREEVIKIRKKATVHKFAKRSHEPIEEVDNELFQDLYVKAVVVGWTGLSLKYLSKLLPVDLSAVEDEDQEMVEYTHENALALMRNAISFDNFVTEQLSELENFSPGS
jgi:hypothetical protein